MKRQYIYSFILIFIFVIACTQKQQNSEQNIRQVIDTIGFAKYDWQMDSIMKRLNISKTYDKTWRIAISPHDDYTYVGDLYPNTLHGLKAKTVVLFGVAHKARNFNLENKIIFDSYDSWSAPYGNVKVSYIRNEMISKLPDSLHVIHDEMQSIEHSLEALIPFLQYNNRDLEIIPVLVPYMTYEKMQQIANSFSEALAEIIVDNNLKWGEDIAILISTDAVHYGDDDWGDKNYAPYGTDSIGLLQARNHELEIINNCLVGNITNEKIKQFVNYTVQDLDYKEYKWTWCGRYSVPFGLLTAEKLNKELNGNQLNGIFVRYSTSIDHPYLKVDDLGMGTTAPATNNHWVGYAAVAYE
ncbi:MAG TPA: AmmeMemoRadiSam system protein B [Bacteroidales bacterium]|nr:AmmeMemoRadiSam system protein B [Bacteroidales bacterium]